MPVSLKITPVLIAKTIVSTVMSVMGMYYLNVGRNERAIGPMIRGAVLIMLSLFIF
jgi:hypothetical protein